MIEKQSWPNYSELLRSVSRSFYLSIKFLPTSMREPIALGYLLARLSDTLADCEAVPLEERRNALSTYRKKVVDLDPEIEFENYRSKVDHPGEKNLLDSASQIIYWLSQIDEANQTAIQQVLAKITSGQTWDINHFQSSDTDTSEEQFYTYTHSVAGCVGEFWTTVGYLNLGDQFARFDDREFMMRAGKKLGQGLQTLNIIRDLHEDIPAGRTYLPDDDIEHWITVCREFLEEGIAYIKKVRDPRVKFATALPLFLAQATADRLEAAGEIEIKKRKIKVPRSTVWKMAAKAALFT